MQLSQRLPLFLVLLSVPLCFCLKALFTWSYVILRNFPGLQLLTCPPDATNPGQPTPTSEIFPDLLTFPNHSSLITHLPLMISSVLGVNILNSPALAFGQFFILSICILVSAICTCAIFSACCLPCPSGFVCFSWLLSHSWLWACSFEHWFSKVPFFPTRSASLGPQSYWLIHTFMTTVCGSKAW